MTHYTITYSERGRAKTAKAVADCRDWLGDAHYSKIRKVISGEFIHSQSPMRQRGMIRFIAMSLCISGIQGYPAHALVIDVLRHGA